MIEETIKFCCVLGVVGFIFVYNFVLRTLVQWIPFVIKPTLRLFGFFWRFGGSISENLELSSLHYLRMITLKVAAVSKSNLVGVAGTFFAETMVKGYCEFISSHGYFRPDLPQGRELGECCREFMNEVLEEVQDNPQKYLLFGQKPQPAEEGGAEVPPPSEPTSSSSTIDEATASTSQAELPASSSGGQGPSSRGSDEADHRVQQKQNSMAAGNVPGPSNVPARVPAASPGGGKHLQAGIHAEEQVEEIPRVQLALAHPRPELTQLLETVMPFGLISQQAVSVTVFGVDTGAILVQAGVLMETRRGYLVSVTNRGAEYFEDSTRVVPGRGLPLMVKVVRVPRGCLLPPLKIDLPEPEGY